MRISPISTIQMTNFKAKSISSRMSDMRNEYGWWKWNVGGGKSDARNRAESQLNDECNNSERDARIAEEKAQSFYQYSRTKLEAQEAKIREKQNTLSELQSITNQNNRTISRLKAEASSNGQTIARNYQEAERLTQEHNDLNNKLTQSEKEYSDLKEEARKNKNKSDNYIYQKVKEAKNNFKTKQEANIAEAEMRMQNADALAEQFAKVSVPPQRTGLSQIQGYDYAKKTLSRLFTEPMQSNNETNIPNGVLLYGPQGCGKTTLAQAFAESTDNKIIYFKPTMNDDKAYNQLVDIIHFAKETFQNSKKRTFIMIDEFDSFAPKNNMRSKRMKNLTDFISEGYHCSILATTNFPENINSTLLRDGRFEKIAIGPADEGDLRQIIYRYLNGCFNNEAEIDKLISIILNNKNGRYSNSLIRDIIDNCIARANIMKLDLDGTQLFEAFNDTIPDITNKFLKHFKQQIQYMQKI